MRRLAALVRQLPRESATVRSVDPTAAWTVGDYLLATAVDALHTANWQRGGNARAARPQPIRRPGAPEQIEGKRIGTTMPLHAMRRLAADWAAGRITLPERHRETLR